MEKKFFKIKYSDTIFKILLMVFVFFLLSFYKMMIEHGDNPAHLKFVEAIFNKNINGGYMMHMIVYPLYHITTRIVSFVCLNDIYMAGMCVLTLSNIVSVIIIRYILNDICNDINAKNKYLIDLLSFFYLFFQTLASPLTEWRIYQRQCGANPWHNPTISFVRPIGLIALYFFVEYIIGIKNENEKRNNLIYFSILSFLSVLAKPSFMMVFLPAMGFFVFFYWVKDLKKRFPIAMRILVAVIPTVALILFQLLFCQFYNNGNVSPVKLQFGGFSEFTFVEIIKVCIATFPIPIMGLILYGRKILESVYSQIGYMALVFGIIEIFLITNGKTGDFSWGYDLAVGVSTMITLGITLNISDYKWKRKTLFVIFLCQVVIGFYYVIKVYNGGTYWF